MRKKINLKVNPFNKRVIKINTIKKVCLSFLLAVSFISCSNQISIENINNSQKINIFKISNDNFGEINFKINLNSPIFEKKDSVNNFSIKNNTNGGALAKTNTDVTNFLVYLIKNASTTGYPAGGDPLNTTDLVSGPFTVANTSDTSIKFTGVKPLDSGAYYVAVRAVDNVPNDLIKVNNGSGTAWGTTTAGAPYNGKVAVSSGAGITVNSSTYAVNTINSLNVPVNLIDGIGAGITVQTTINQVNTDPFVKPIFYNINTIAGTGTAGSTGDGGLATAAQLNLSSIVEVDSSGNVYIADTSNHKIRKISASTGFISTIAGTGTAGITGDGGLATSAALNSPRGLTFDSLGNVYIADTGNHKIRKISASTGFISTIAGTGTGGSTGDGGLAISSQLRNPTGLAVDSFRNIYISDSNNSKIRKLD